MNKLSKSLSSLLAGLAAALMMNSAQPASVTISTVPLATSSGANILPNLLFTLDTSGSMSWDYLPDYVNDSFKCLTQGSGAASFSGSTTCNLGDPPYRAGGSSGFNGVAYDPNVNYRPAVDSLGRTVLNWTTSPPTTTTSPLPTTALLADAYLGGGTINLTSGVSDRRYCNAAATAVCKRNGTDSGSPTALVGGTDSSGNTMSAGRFPYRSHASNSSTQIFGLPEIMSMGISSGDGTTITVSTTAPHGLATGNTIYVRSAGGTGYDFDTKTITSTGTRSFTYAGTGNGAVTGASYTRTGSTITVTKATHGLSTGDLVTVSLGNTSLDATAAQITRVSSSVFRYSLSGSATVSTTAGGYTRVFSAQYRKHDTGTFVQTGTTLVTVTTAVAHGLVTNDVITTSVPTGASAAVASKAITVTSTTTFTYTGTSATINVAGTWVRDGLYNIGTTISTPAMSYFITPIEYCTNANLTDCQQVIPPATPPSGYTFPAYVRFCQTQEQALAPGGIGDSSGTPRCRNKFINSGSIDAAYQWPRFGWYNRDTIQSGVTTYANRAGRTDCVAAPVCTYTEEIQNYARWYTYYRTRLQMMKTASGRAFLPFVSNPSASPVPVPNKVRVGFITINPFYDNAGSLQSSVQSAMYLKIDAFNTTQAASWYNKFYSQATVASTPLREALSRGGWIFAGKLNTGLTSGIPLADDPLEASCQRNYNLFTTDGYWNGNGGQDISGTAMANADNVNNLTISPYTSVMVDRTTTGTFDGGAGTVVTTATPTVITEENVCYGSANTTFSSGTQIACGCTGTEQRLRTRTSTTTQTISTTDGVQTANSTSVAVAAFPTPAACVAANVVTTPRTGTTIVEEQVVVQGATSTFPTYGTPTTGANITVAGCTANQVRLLTRTTTVNTSNVTTNGVSPGVDSYTAGTTSYGIVQGACTSRARTETYSGAHTVEWVTTSEGSGLPTSFSPAAPNGDNRQTTFTCSGSGIRTMRLRRVTNYTKTVVYDAAGAVTSTTYTSFPTATSTFSTPGSCSTSGYVANAPSTVENLTSTLYSGGPTAASSSTTLGTGGTAVVTGGTLLAVSQSPNPSVPTVGTPTSTTTYGGYPNTLADVAMYYYRTDLRGGTDLFGNTTGPSLNLGGTGTVDVSPNNIPVKAGAKDFATHQHMTTFTIGLADGFMRYQSDYETATSGDFVNIKNGAAAGTCFWTSGVCNWPQPFADDASALDDLWHAGVNGRGQFYSALNVDALVSGISNTLNSVNAQVAAAAASATSSPNVTQTDNQIFSTTYETITWAGKVFAQTIDPATGSVLPTVQWQADSLLLAKVAAATDTRLIYTLDLGATDKVKTFDWASLTATQKTYFTNRCVPSTGMTQCSGLTAAQLTIANDGSLLLGYLRGWSANEGAIFRDRTYLDPVSNSVIQTVLGDTISAKPAYLRGSNNNYTDTGYSTFVTTNSTRSPRVFVGANDGYLHAFNGNTGDEAWAFTPSFLMPGLYQLADNGYATAHRYYVDGSPETADVYDTTAGAWKTILVGGAAGGGAGFYALDVTNPDAPKGLWEFCSSASLCAVSDTDLGLAYGNPIIGKRAYDGRWVVVLSSGLNNTTGSNPGVGYFYVLDAITGALLHKVSTGAGSVTTPSGLMKMSAYFDNAVSDATFRYVYAGDQLGNVWRLDMLAAPTAPATVASPRPAPTVLHLASLKDASGTPRAQPITTRPTLTHIGTTRIIYIGTGRFLGSPDLTDPGASSGIAWQQSLYAFKDKDADYGSTNFRTDATLLQQTLSSLSPTTRGITANATTMDWATKDGWYIDFNPSFAGVPNSPGEGVNLVDPKLVLGTLVVTTNAPSQGSSSCSVGGSSFAYNFDFKTGLAVSSSAGGVVGSSLGGTITVGVAIVQLPSGAIKSINTGADTTKTTESVNTSASGAAVKRFSYRTR